MALLILSVPSEACGPYVPIIPTPNFFRISGSGRNMSHYEREENLKLWQSITSERIPAEDIEEAVYHDSGDVFVSSVAESSVRKDNLFYIYLDNSDNREIINFLTLAKTLEEQWRDMRSPWYYPEDRYHDKDSCDFGYIIEQCKDYDGTLLKDRYALQIARALFASREYAACIEHTDSAFSDVRETNLMRRMAQRYAAGSWSRLGEVRRADSLFAEVGDVWSISGADPVQLMADLNPDAPQLMEYIRCRAADTAFMRSLAPVVEAAISDARVRCKADWHFLKAYIDNEFNNDAALARKSIYRAMRLTFSSEELKDLARSYKMKLDGQAGEMQELLEDLRWIEGKADELNREAKEWVRRCRNVIYTDWVPGLWQRKDYGMAILLCAYADNLSPTESAGKRGAEKSILPARYGSLSFQMMGSLTSSQLAAAYRHVLYDTPLCRSLRERTRSDSDYYYELIGTLALREENYARAISYLSKVSERYLKSMNIDSGGYLSRDPFRAYDSRWEAVDYHDGEGETWEWERSTAMHSESSNPGAKLDFARKMKTYQYQMEHGRTADERGMASLMYAIGRRNALEECWALTQYWRGDCVDIFEPVLQYWNDDFSEDNYGFLYRYEHSVGHKATERIYKRQVEEALAMLESDEAKAKANYILGNLATIIKNYGNTPTARYVKTSCDNWRMWL